MSLLNNRIRRLVASPDDGADVLVLTDAPTVTVYTNCSSGSSNTPSFVRRTEEPSELPSAPTDAVWCPYKQGDANSSYLATSWGSPVQLLDVEDGAPRGCYYAANTMDEVCYAQSLLWLRAPTRREQFIAGYGRATECCFALFDVMKTGKCPIYTYEPTSAKSCNYSADASSSAIIVSALAEVRANLVAMGCLRGAIELVDLRSKCCAGAISGGTSNGSGNTARSSAFVRHKAGVVQILSLDGPSLSASMPAASATATDDHRFITVPRCGDDNILAWDMRCLSNPVGIINRGPTPDNTFRNVGLLGTNLVASTAQGLATIPLSTLFGSQSPILAADYRSASASAVSINITSGASQSAGASVSGPIAVVGQSVVTASVGPQSAVPDAKKYIADGNGVGHKRGRRDQGAANGNAGSDDEDYVVTRSRRVFGNAAHQKIVLSDDE
eukprot:GILI01019100.1.p1 GENE.GILI01019100.1~~GILI01019100.1.p1  ORF type:complete len:442 (-),score=76.93 GILI01019100.1:46-1371(-)